MPRYTIDGDRRKSPFRFLRIFLEIPIIVFSIYIAFVVDEWGKEKAEAVSEQNYLEELLQEVNINIKELAADQEERRNQIILLDKMLESSIRTVAPDTLRMAIDELLTARVYSPTDAVYQDLVSSGNLRLITSEPLRYKIMEYRRKLARAPVTEQSDIDFIANQVEPYLIGKQVLSLLEPHEDVKGIDISDQQKDRIIRVLLNDRTFIDLVYLRRHRIRDVEFFENPMQWYLDDMVELIEEQLKVSE